MRSRASAALVVIGTSMPGVFAAAVVVGMSITVVTLVRTPAVDIGLFRSVGHDALSLYLGHGLYHNPAGNGYTGSLYTPLEPLLISLVDRLRLWNGWPVALTVGATAVLGLSVAWAARRAAADRRPQTIVGALWLLALGFRGQRPWRFTAALLGSLLAVNLAVLGALLLGTGGWELYFTFLLPARQATLYGPRTFASDLLHAVSVPARWALGATSVGRDGRSRARLDSVGGSWSSISSSASRRRCTSAASRVASRTSTSA